MQENRKYSIPTFQREYLPKYSYHEIRRNILKESENLLFLGLIEKEEKIKIIKYRILKPDETSFYLLNLKPSALLPLEEIMSTFNIERYSVSVNKIITLSAEMKDDEIVIIEKKDKVIIRKLSAFFKILIKNLKNVK